MTTCQAIQVVRNDGGRADAGFTGEARDCVTRAIAIATGKPYREVYDDLNKLARRERPRKSKRSAARTGVHRRTYEPYLLAMGWAWAPTMRVGQGCTVHLRPDELPGGTLIVAVSRHLTAVVDGVIHDTHNPSRGGTRCVYGYYRKAPPMTDPQLRIEVAKRLGLNAVGMAHCWAPDGPPWSVLQDDQSHKGHDYSPVYLVDEDDRTGCNLLGQACGYSVADLRRVPDYPGDPREWVRLLEAIAAHDGFEEIARIKSGWYVYFNGVYYKAPTLGRAVCLAWIAWHDATGGEGSDAG